MRPLSGMPLCISNLSYSYFPAYLLINSHDVHAAFQSILEFHSFTHPSRVAMSVSTLLTSFNPSQISYYGSVC